MLRTRILSALVLAPIALVVAWHGGVLFHLFIALLGGLMAWEWDRICRGRFGATGKLIAAVAVALALVGAEHPGTALSVAWVGLLAAAVMSRSGWLALGSVYVGLPVIALVWLRDAGGATTLFWLLAVVWATDTGAYAAGRTIGGPRLAPRISPKKTWSGLIGGMTSAAIAAALVGWFVEADAVWLLALLGALLAAVAQIGDLFESSVKRRFNVKDSSAIIPGHGGVLDRVDGLIAAAPPVALLVVAYGGGVEVWR